MYPLIFLYFIFYNCFYFLVLHGFCHINPKLPGFAILFMLSLPDFRKYFCFLNYRFHFYVAIPLLNIAHFLPIWNKIHPEFILNSFFPAIFMLSYHEIFYLQIPKNIFCLYLNFTNLYIFRDCSNREPMFRLYPDCYSNGDNNLENCSFARISIFLWS